MPSRFDQVPEDTDDIELSGLLDGFVGPARDDRDELIRWLMDRGFGLGQIRNSLSPIMLASNRIIGDDGTTVSATQVAEDNGLPLELVKRLHRSAGLASANDPEGTLHSRADAESILPAAALVAYGFDVEEVALLVRLLVDGLTRVAVTMRQAALQVLIRPGATELELAVALEQLSLEVEPLLDPMINGLARLALRHTFQTEAVNAAERAAGQLPGARPVTVAFADVVGFTTMGEAVSPQDLVRVAGRLANLTRSVVRAPVQFVKTIGDAVMLVSPDAEELVSTILDLLEAAEFHHLPQLRAGVASGLAVSRAGDWYGSPVNLASRVTNAAPAGAALITDATREAIGDASNIAFTFEKSTHVRGIRDEIRMFRVSKT
jgi:adenylate cyclase